MRIITAAGISALVDESQLVILNPWEPHPGHGAPADHLLEEQTKPSAATQNEGLVAPPSGKGLLR